MAEDVTVSIRADTAPFQKALQSLERLSDSFGAQLTGAMKSAVVSGRELDDILRRIGLNLAGMALQQGLKPLQSLAGSLFSGMLGGILPFAKGGRKDPYTVKAVGMPLEGTPMTSAQIVRPRAYSYVRFSTPEQAAGDSLRRQTEKAEKYAAKHGLILDDKLNMHDLGVSAFRGANVAMGALGNFLSLAQHGDIASGSHLLVENFDRVSRDTIFDAQMVLLALLEAGVTVVTLSNEKAYSKESLRSDQWAIFEIVLGFIRANEESARKQELLRDAWHGKRLKLKDGKPMTKLCPGWLRLKDDRSRYEVIEGRAEVVRRIYDMTLVGVGLHSIATALNREGVPVFGTAKLWQSAYIHKVLNSEAVVGRFTPRRRDRGTDGKTVRVAAGETVEGYFPSVVDVETWEKVRGMGSRSTAPIRSSNWGCLA